MLRVLERKMFWKIYSPVQKNDGPRELRMDHEVYQLIHRSDIFILVKKRTLVLMGHLTRMDQQREPKRASERMRIDKRRRGRARKRRKYDVEEDLQVMDVRKWQKVMSVRLDLENAFKI